MYTMWRRNRRDSEREKNDDSESDRGGRKNFH